MGISPLVSGEMHQPQPSTVLIPRICNRAPAYHAVQGRERGREAGKDSTADAVDTRSGLPPCVLPLNNSREVRPLFDAEGADVSHRLWKPRAGARGLDGQKEIGHILAVGDVQASLHASKAVFAEHGAYLRIRLGDALRVVFLGIAHGKVKGDGVHQRASGSSIRWVIRYSALSPVSTILTSTSQSPSSIWRKARPTSYLGPNEPKLLILPIGRGGAEMTCSSVSRGAALLSSSSPSAAPAPCSAARRLWRERLPLLLHRCSGPPVRRG